MPYEKDGNLIPRVTEVIGSGECEATAYIEKDEKLRKGVRTSHMVTLPGTMLHAKIEQELKEEVGMKVPKLPLKGLDGKLLTQLRLQHQKMRKKDPKCQTTYDDIMNKVHDCYANYLAFRIDHPFTPLLIERRMFSRKFYKVGGTVDMVALTEIKGYQIIATPDAKHLPKKQYFKMCDHTTPCKCFKQKVVIVCDWKSSVTKQEGHRLQMSIYFCMLEELGVFDKFRQKGYDIGWETWSLLLGKREIKPKARIKTPYRLHWYDPTVDDFLVSWDVYNNARYMSINLKGKTGIKGRCMFCAYLPNCPDRIMWDIEGNVLFPTFFSRKELAQIEFLANRVGGEQFDELRDRVKEYVTTSRNHDKELENGLDGALEEIEEALGVKTS